MRAIAKAGCARAARENGIANERRARPVFREYVRGR